MNKNRLNGLLFAFLLGFVLSGCSNSGENGQSADTRNNQTGDSAIQKDSSQQALVVDGYRCSGCGKCVSFDPEHFAFGIADRKIEVVSNENLNTNDLALAMAACRDRAISIM